jgi:ribosomal protein L7/L12
MGTPAPEEMAKIEETLRQGQKTAAIMLYRECTGVGLAEAKAAVEDIEAKMEARPTTLQKGGENLAPVEEALFRGKKILAIKRYRQCTDAALAEAKMAVERLERELRFKSPEKFIATEPDEGCLGMVVLLIVVALVGTCVWLGTWSSEPQYQGRRVSAWVRDLQGKSAADREKAEAALRQIGTNALPVLRRQLHLQDSALKLALVRFVWRQDRVRLRVMLARGWNVRAALACGILGPGAQPLIPDLLELSKRDFVGFEVAVSALSQIGEAAIPQLKVALTHRNASVRQAAARALGAIGPKARDAVPTLIQSLHDADSQVRLNASAALGAIGVGSPEVVGALAAALGDSNSDVRDNVVDALGQLGLQAKAAVPALLKMLSDPEELVRIDSSNALETITPAALPPQTPIPKTAH